VTNRTARYLRAPEGIERTFRTATIGLAKTHAFARSLINTGRMAEANRYEVSDVCQQDGGFMVQNAALLYNRQHCGSLAELLQWANGRLLLLVFGQLSRKDIAKLQSLSTAAGVNVVQVTHKKSSQVREHVLDPDKTLRRACHAEKAQWVLIRPDAYVSAKGKAINGQLVKALANALALHE